jgi:hypothetical protein
MNTNPGSAPRLACRAARLRAALAGDPGRSAHVAGCADCQRHFAAAAAFDTALRRDASRPAADIPAGLERGILRAVAESRLEPAHAEKSSGTLAWLAGAALAAAAAVAVVFALRPPAPAPGGTLTAETNPRVETIAPRESAVEAPLPSTPVLKLPSASALVSQNPLQSEIDNVYSDTKYALRFLALNFLPAAALEGTAAARNDKG